MKDKNKLDFPKKKVPVTSRLTGETTLVEVPIGKLMRDKLIDEVNLGEVREAKSVGVLDAAAPVLRADEPTLVGEKGADSDDKNKKAKIESCDEYLRLYFTKNIKLTDETIQSIGIETSVSSNLREQLIDNAIRLDFSLDRTRQLFVLSLNANNYSSLAKSLRDFARDVVCRHPVMSMQERESWFPSSSQHDDSNIKSIWNGFVNSTAKPENITADEDGRADKKTNTADIQKARKNAFLCAHIWRYAEKQANFSELFRSLRATVFQSTSKSKDLEKNLISYLASAQDKAQSGVADFARWFQDQTVSVQNQANHYQQQLDSLQHLKQEVDEILATKEVELASLSQQVSGLLTQVEAMEEEVRILKVHSKDDLERQASRTLRALEDEIPVLTDCLTALNRDPPKVEVAKEYLGAALDTLNNELKVLREK